VPPVATEQAGLEFEVESIRSSSVHNISLPKEGVAQEYEGGKYRGDGSDEVSVGKGGDEGGDWESLVEREVEAE